MENSEIMKRVLNIGIALTAERDINRLFDTILIEAMAITNCDAGTLYIMEDGLLHFKVMRNNSLGTYAGGTGKPIDLPPLEISEKSVAAYVTIHRRMENIADVYETDERFDFSGPHKYDNLTGYRTKSMLVIPLIGNRDEIVGTLQLMNAMDSEGKVIPFAEDFEEIFRSISAQAAIAVTNMKYVTENKELFQSLVEVLAAAIDERSHYNANHTRHVAELTREFVDFLNLRHEEGRSNINFSEEDAEQLVMAAWLHDIGKIITPLEIMDKTTRLGWGEQLVELRFDTILTAEHVRFLEGKITLAEFEALAHEIGEAKDLCAKANSGAPTSGTEMALIESYGKRICEMPGDKIMRWLEPGEIECLAIRYGTLTAAERKIMEEHVEITQRLLSKINFSHEYRDVPVYAADHHEKLNGCGYPQGKTAEELPMAARILTVMDIYEALTAKDRPYKKPMPLETALEILDKMAVDGEIDAEVVKWVREWAV